MICRTCCKPIASPYRVFDARGKVVQGCISADHNGAYLLGESAFWHNRQSAKKYRRESAKRFPVVALA